MSELLSIEQLTVSVDSGQSVLKGIDFHVAAGEVHAIMGPNGSGKSTLSHVLAGRPGYQVDAGKVLFNGEDLLALTPEARAVQGIFLAFQYPVAIPGLNNLYFLKAAVNRVREQRGEAPLDAMDFLTAVRAKLDDVGLDERFLYRGLNDGFSGGEKKRNEILQMLLLSPKLALLDETDSGLDIDALQTIAKAVNQTRDAQRSIIMVTHYQRLLDYIVPDYVHVLMHGRIVKSGDASLAKTLEKQGYAWLEKEAAKQ